MIPTLILAVLTATPTTLPVLAKSGCGDTVMLIGSFGPVTVPRVECPDSNRLEINAGGATMTSLVFRSTSGVSISRGKVAGSGGGAAVTVDAAKRVRIAGMVVSGARVGLTIVRSTDVEAIGNRFDGVRSDGINLTMTQRVRLIGNACLNFQPIPATYDAAGKLLVDGDHPDCIQGWTTAGTAPVADVLIAGNTADGPMQGVWFGNPGTGGYDRITIRDNDLRIGAWHGVSVYEGRGTVIQNNRVMPIPGARQLGGNRGLVWPWVYTTGDALACGNVVAAQASRYGTGACK